MVWREWSKYLDLASFVQVENIELKTPKGAAFSKNMLKPQHGKLKPNKLRGLTWI